MIYTNKRSGRLNRLLPQLINEFLLDKEHKALLDRKRNSTAFKNEISSKPVFVFVLLQYNHTNLTVDCISSIDSLVVENGEKRIVVVDNSPANDSFSEIKNMYINRKDIFVIRTGGNLGYAKGNNYGYRFAVENLNPDFIIIANNDIIFHDSHTLEKVRDKFVETGFSILGPDIIVKNDTDEKHQNPHGYYFKTTDDTLAFIEENKRKLESLPEDKDNLVPPKVYGRSQKDYYERSGALVLHGSVYFFSINFIHDFEEPFDNRTFLYGEEGILALRAYSRGHILVYSPDIEVFHMAGSSMDKMDYYKYYKRRYKFNYESAYVYLDVLDEIAKKI